MEKKQTNKYVVLAVNLDPYNIIAIVTIRHIGGAN